MAIPGSVPVNAAHAADAHTASHIGSPNQVGGSGSALPMNRKQRLEAAKSLLESSGNDLTWVAAQLGIHPTTLYRWRKAGKL